jgi:predicted alpha/beta-fold hydrolase
MHICQLLQIVSRVALVCVYLQCNAATEILKTSDGTESKLKVSYQKASEASSLPTVVLAHGSAGVSANHYWWADVINKWGYNAVIIDHYTLRGISRHTGRPVDGARMRDRAKDFADVVAWVGTQPWHKGKISIVVSWLS